MLCRLSAIGVLLALSGCTESLVFQDMWDAGTFSPSDARDAIGGSAGDASGGNRPDLERADGLCSSGIRPLHPTPETPQLFILLDRSSAMRAPMGTVKREDAAGDALISAIGQYQGLIKFGFQQFPAGPLEQVPDAGAPRTCYAGKVHFQPGFFALLRIKGPLLCDDQPFFQCPEAAADSPSYAGLASINEYYTKRSDERDPRYVLLVTASEPRCDADSSIDPCDSALNAAAALGNINVRVVVLSVGYQPPPSSCLVKISQRRSRLDVPAGAKSLYTPSTVAELNQQVGELMLAVAKSSCTLKLEWGPPDQAQLVVSLGPNEVPQDPTDGWSFPDASKTSIVLSGKACTRYVDPKANDPLSVGYRFCP